MTLFNDIEIQKLTEYLQQHKKLAKQSFSNILDLLLDIQTLDNDAKLRIISALKNTSTESNYHDSITTTIQILAGILHGINCDNTLTDKEIISLQTLLENHEKLKQHYPYDELRGMLSKILQDNMITEQEREDKRGKCGELLTSTDYLIVCNKGSEVWTYTTYGRKIEKAITLRKEGQRIKIIPEKTLWENLEACPL